LPVQVWEEAPQLNMIRRGLGCAKIAKNERYDDK